MGREELMVLRNKMDFTPDHPVQAQTWVQFQI